MTATGSLKAVFLKAAALPAAEQDEIARIVTARVAGDSWDEPAFPGFPRVPAFARAIDAILPKHPAARTIALGICCFTLFVQAPAMILFGIYAAVQTSREASTPATAVRQTAVGVIGTNQVVGVPGVPPAPAAPPMPAPAATEIDSRG